MKRLKGDKRCGDFDEPVIALYEYVAAGVDDSVRRRWRVLVFTAVRFARYSF